jgi:hypothetical protein
VSLRQGRRLGGHRGLADARLAGEQDHLPAAGGRRLDGAAQLGEHVAPPDQPA